MLTTNLFKIFKKISDIHCGVMNQECISRLYKSNINLYQNKVLLDLAGVEIAPIYFELLTVNFGKS